MSAYVSVEAVVQVLLFVVPWGIRRCLLRALFGFDISPTARIGMSLILVKNVILRDGARIGNLNVIKGLSTLCIDDFASLGNLNWVTATPIGSKTYFTLETKRCPSLYIERHAAITHRHLIDCTDRITIGSLSTFGGWRSQILTHAIDLHGGRQSCAPVRIGHHCFVGTGVIILKGSSLPDRSVLAAGSVLATAMKEEGMIYGGVPATSIRSVDANGKYFTRQVGFVY